MWPEQSNAAESSERMTRIGSTSFVHIYETSQIAPLANLQEIGFNAEDDRVSLSIRMTPEVAFRVVKILQRQIAEAAFRPEPAPTAPVVEPEF